MKCLYIDERIGQDKISAIPACPAIKPMCYCHAKSRSECQGIADTRNILCEWRVGLWCWE